MPNTLASTNTIMLCLVPKHGSFLKAAVLFGKRLKINGFDPR